MIGKNTGLDPDGATVGTSSTEVLPFRYGREGLILTNISNNLMFIGLEGTPAVIDKGMAIAPNGGVWNMVDQHAITNGAVHVIAASADSKLTIQEFVDSRPI